MRIENIFDFRKRENFSSVLGIGKFDGFHIGHQRIIDKILELSRELDCKPAVFTIRNYPASSVLMSWEEKLEVLEKNGVEICLWADFYRLRTMTHIEFLEKIYSICTFRAICVGSNFRFGHNRRGDIKYIKHWARQKSVKVCTIKPITISGKIVSSTIIKTMISRSEFQNARLMLGRWYSLEGICIRGRAIGRQIGFPTINIDLRNKNTPLTHGVYSCIVKRNDRLYKAVIFYGSSKTFDLPVSFEIHIPNMKLGNEYGSKFIIVPLRKIRGVRKFSDTSALIERIRNDIAETQEFFNSFDLTEFKKSCNI